jgi:hypothetical protein
MLMRELFAIVPSLFAGYPTYSVWTYDLNLELIESVNVSRQHLILQWRHITCTMAHSWPANHIDPDMLGLSRIIMMYGSHAR